MTDTDIPAEAAHWGKATRTAWLRSNGVAEQTAEWHDWHRRLADIASGETARQIAAAKAFHEARVAPFLAEARSRVMAWGCVEEMEAGEERDAEIERLAEEEAEEMAIAAEEAEQATRDEAERIAAEDREYLARMDALTLAVTEAREIVTAAGWTIEERKCSSDSSRYFWLSAPGDDDLTETLSLRISDHFARNGAGWNEARQEQHQPPDINIVLRRTAADTYHFDLTPLSERI